jgi:tetratricopeptide (TPR) repeat protein
MRRSYALSVLAVGLVVAGVVAWNTIRAKELNQRAADLYKQVAELDRSAKEQDDEAVRLQHAEGAARSKQWIPFTSYGFDPARYFDSAAVTDARARAVAIRTEANGLRTAAANLTTEAAHWQPRITLRPGIEAVFPSYKATRIGREGADAMSRGNHKDAIRLLSEAVRLSPKVPKYRYNLGLALAKAGLLEQSATELETVIQADPADIEARRLLGRIQNGIAGRQAALVADELR